MTKSVNLTAPVMNSPVRPECHPANMPRPNNSSSMHPKKQKKNYGSGRRRSAKRTPLCVRFNEVSPYRGVAFQFQGCRGGKGGGFYGLDLSWTSATTLDLSKYFLLFLKYLGIAKAPFCCQYLPTVLALDKPKLQGHVKQKRLKLR